jgi:hypothetical protein
MGDISVPSVILSFVLGALLTAFAYTMTIMADIADMKRTIKDNPLFNLNTCNDIVSICKEHADMSKQVDDSAKKILLFGQRLDTIEGQLKSQGK